MNKDKVIHQIFVGKVAETIGFEKTKLLLKGARDVFEVVSEGESVNECERFLTGKNKTKMITWNIDLTNYTEEQLEALLEIVEVMDNSIAIQIVDYLIETYGS